MMRKTKKLAVVMGFLLLMAVITTVPVFAAKSGGWSVSKARYSFLTSGQEKMFNKAVKGLTGVSYKPVAVVMKGHEESIGSAYLYLCQGTTVTKKPAKAWYLMCVLKNEKKKISVEYINKIKVSDIKTRSDETSEYSSKDICVVKNKPAALSKEARDVFNKGTKKYVGVDLRPIALLGTQIVAGKNYRFLCSGIALGEKDVYVVDIYKKTNGKCKVTFCEPLDILSYIE